VDSDGDVEVRRCSTAKSSSSEDEQETSTIGLKSKQEFAKIVEKKKVGSSFAENDAALGKGQATVYRDKKTGERQQKPGKDRKDIEEENAILSYELNMGSTDKLSLKGEKPLDEVDDKLEEDPMARFFRKATDVEQLTPTGKPRYKGRAPPPNRFQILPGYRWDGVDRSNGFEPRLLRKRNERLASSGS